RAHTVTLYQPLTAPLHTGDAVTFQANGAKVQGLQDGATYYVVDNQPGAINPVTFAPTAVVTGSSALLVPNHHFSTREASPHTTSGTAIAPLSSGGTYYVIVLDDSTIELASSLANAQSGLALTLSETVAGGTQTLTPVTAAQGSAATFSPSPVVDATAHTIT